VSQNNNDKKLCNKTAKKGRVSFSLPLAASIRTSLKDQEHPYSRRCVNNAPYPGISVIVKPITRPHTTIAIQIHNDIPPASFAGSGVLLRIEELNELIAMVRRRLRRGR